MYRWIDHTSEVELAIEAPSEREVLVDALLALAELLGYGAKAPAAAREVEVRAADRPALLAEWLEELVYLAETDGFVATSVEELALGESSVSARVGGVLEEPPPLVKAVTYHRLEFRPAASGYVANVVLDV